MVVIVVIIMSTMVAIVEVNRRRITGQRLKRDLLRVPLFAVPLFRASGRNKTTSDFYIPQRGVQRKQGVVIYMMLCTFLLSNTTPIRCTPLPLHPPLMNSHDWRAFKDDSVLASSACFYFMSTSSCLPGLSESLSLSLYLSLYICVYIYIYI